MATNTATSFTNHTAPSSGATAGPYAISFDYLEQSDVDVTVNGTLQALGVKYTFTSGTQITFTSGNEPANGAAIVIKRDTNISAKKVDFQDGSVLTETDLDTNTEQLLFGLQEFADKINAIEDSATSDQTNAEIRAAVEAATDSNVFTDADHSKLDGLTSSIDAVLNSDLDGKGELLVGDGSGDPSALPVGTNGYILKVNTSTATGLEWVSTNTISVPLTGLNASNLISGTIPDARFPATLPAISAANLTSIPAANITGTLPAISGANLTGITSTTAATLATPRTIAGVSFDGSANISLNNNAITNGAGYIDGSALNAANLSSGTIPDARFPATLPTASGVNLTALNGSNIASGTIAAARIATLNQNTTGTSGGFTAGDASNLNAGTIPDARFPATLPAASAANLTALPAANITGALPALDGSALTGISGGVTVQEEGSSLSTAGTTLNFVGSGVTASGTGATKTITIAASGLSDVVNDTTPQLGGNLDVQGSEINTSTTDGNIVLNPNGAGVVEVKGDGTTSGTVGTIKLNCSNNNHGVKIASPPHSAAQNYTLTLPSSIVNGGFLKTDSNGGLSFATPTDTNTTYSAGTGLSLSGTTFSVDKLNQNTTGSAATLTTPRAINGVNFDGSAAITVADSTKMPLTGGTFSAEVIFQKEITETVFAITDASSVALDPINGMIQTWTLGANRTATDSLTTGQSMLLIVTASGSAYTMTWPTMTWVGGSAPTLGGATPTAIELFKVGSTLYGATVGDLG